MGSLLGKRWGRGGRTTSASWTNMESIRNYQINTLVSPIWGSSGLQRSSRGSSWRREKFPQLYVYMLLSGNSMLWLWWPLFYRFNIKWCERVFAFCFVFPMIFPCIDCLELPRTSINCTVCMYLFYVPQAWEIQLSWEACDLFYSISWLIIQTRLTEKVLWCFSHEHLQPSVGVRSYYIKTKAECKFVKFGFLWYF